MATMLLFAIAANADNLIVAAAYRLRGVVITWRANGVISLITGFCMLVRCINSTVSNTYIDAGGYAHG